MALKSVFLSHRAAATDTVTMHHLKRITGFILGTVLFYAPFALLMKGAALLFPQAAIATVTGDAHQACLRMPITWLAQPWLLPSMFRNPLYLITLFVPPVSAFFFGPLFCGWACPAGGFTEYLSRFVPDKLKFDLKGRVDFAPIRYGFFVGLLIAPFVTSNFCCSLCNFTGMQNIVSASLGDLSGFAYWSTTGIISLAVWLLVLGIFTKGGRGWCNFLCPTGALQALFNRWGLKYPWTYRVRHDEASCARCDTCEDVCPTRSIQRPIGVIAINPHVCNACLDCVTHCPTGALSYGRAHISKESPGKGGSANE